MEEKRGFFIVPKRSQASQLAQRREATASELRDIYCLPWERLYALAGGLITEAFWQECEAKDSQQEVAYSDLVNDFLRNQWAGEDGKNFFDDMDAMIGGIYSRRRERFTDDVRLFGEPWHPCMDGLLVLLDDHLNRLLMLHELSGPRYHGLKPSAAVYAAAAGVLKAPPDTFGAWVVDDWLPAQLVHFGARAVRGQTSNSGGVPPSEGGSPRDHRPGPASGGPSP